MDANISVSLNSIIAVSPSVYINNLKNLYIDLFSTLFPYWLMFKYVKVLQIH